MMKKQLLSFLLAIVPTILLTNAQGSLTPEILYYKFDGTGTNVPNYASAPPVGTTTATIMGGLTQGGSNICQGTIIGSGNSSSTDYVNTGWATSLTGSWTISMRTSNITSSSTLFYIFGDANAGLFRCFTNGVAGPNNWILRGSGITDTYINGGATVAPHMTTFVYDITTNNIYGYLDGVLVTTVAQTGPVINGTGPFKVIGYATNVGCPTGGFLDEFRVYSHALTAAEVMELYNPFANLDFLGPDQYSCPNDTTYFPFSASYPFSSITWSDASTNDTLLVPNPGIYSAVVSGACGAGEDTIEFISSLTTSTLNPSPVCAVYTAPSGATFTTSGTYNDTIPNMAGCDSVITLNLTIHQPSTNTLNPSTCAANFTSPSGDVYSTSGMYMDTIANFLGCDSVITINLNLLSSSTSSISPTFCVSYTAPSGAIYNTAGTYLDTIANFQGCDSVITINLTTTPVNIGVTQSGPSGENLSANATPATYQWIDCNTMLPEAGQTGINFTAGANGSYAVIVNEGGCIDTSACFTVAGLGIDNNTLAEIVKLYPNPTKGQFYIYVGATDQTFTLELINNVGQVLQSTLFTNTNVGTMEINGTGGLYFVRITKPNGEKAVLRAIKD